MSDKNEFIRCVTIPVASPANLEWPELWGRLGKAWDASTRLANWAIRELLRAEPEPPVQDGKLGKCPLTYLYGAMPELIAAEWVGGKSSANCVLRAVERQYRNRRFDVLVRHEMGATYRHPYPYPIHNRDWKLEWEKDGACFVNLPILGGDRIKLRLRQGHDFRRQIACLKRLGKDAKQGELKITKRRMNEGDHRGTWRILCQFAIRLEQPEQRPGQTLNLHRDADAFWVAEIDGHRQWCLNADHVRGWIAEHQRRSARFAEDCKYERRTRPSGKQHTREAWEKFCAKHHRRIDTFIEQSTAALTGFCDRNRVGLVAYEDTDRGYLPTFPWFMVRERLAQKLQQVGCQLEVISSVTSEK